ncbi:addiction module toxin, HicA family [Candidatus Heimdallarchaeota archaeon]|nr:MAG: addiction module toxin, HicA family [Candidatus Heimdallarchaeota archaeon]
MPRYKPLSGKTVIKILCNKFGFEAIRQKGSYVFLSKETKKGKIGTVMPLHKELKIGTLRGVLRLAKINIEDFDKEI